MNVSTLGQLWWQNQLPEGTAGMNLLTLSSPAYSPASSELSASTSDVIRASASCNSVQATMLGAPCAMFHREIGKSTLIMVLSQTSDLGSTVINPTISFEVTVST